MSFRLIVLKAKHRRQVRKTNKGFRARQAKLARISAEDESSVLSMTLKEWMDFMRNERGCI